MYFELATKIRSKLVDCLQNEDMVHSEVVIKKPGQCLMLYSGYKVMIVHHVRHEINFYAGIVVYCTERNFLSKFFTNLSYSHNKNSRMEPFKSAGTLGVEAGIVKA